MIPNSDPPAYTHPNHTVAWLGTFPVILIKSVFNGITNHRGFSHVHCCLLPSLFHNYPFYPEEPVLATEKDPVLFPDP